MMQLLDEIVICKFLLPQSNADHKVPWYQLFSVNLRCITSYISFLWNILIEYKYIYGGKQFNSKLNVTYTSIKEAGSQYVNTNIIIVFSFRSFSQAPKEFCSCLKKENPTNDFAGREKDMRLVCKQ